MTRTLLAFSGAQGPATDFLARRQVGASSSICGCLRVHAVERRRPSVRMSSSNSHGDSEILSGPYKGHFGEWYLTQEDKTGVEQYRQALLVAALAACGALAPLASEAVPQAVSDVLFVVAVGALGVALDKIHIYVTPLHKALKFLWAAGLGGSLVVAGLSGGGMLTTAAADPRAMLGIGWVFVAMTGLFFKEAFCFGRMEAVALTALTPVLAGGHFLGIWPTQAESTMAVASGLLMLLFAGSKFSKPVTDDLGDKSVFEHYARLESENGASASQGANETS